ncbi:MAG: flavodoxin domain-containing protein [Anaerolineae bacterium]|nr:flavodoxin domain-containing protein [Anaerolineae bacterium]
MSDKILVAYATRYGSTQEVAEFIADTLRSGGLEVTVQAMKDVPSLADSGMIVLGAPLFIGKWPKDVHQFLSRHQAALSERPVALFTLGPTSTEAADMAGSREQFAQQLGQYPWLKPVAQEVFVGKYDPAKLRFPMSLLIKLPASPLHDAPATDNRDWDAIRAWAEALLPTPEA